MAAVGYLHSRSIGVTVNGNDFDAVTLKFDDDFFSKFAGAAQKGSFRDSSKGRTELKHNGF